MSQMGGPGYRPAAKNNIYTVLVAIAFLTLLGGIIAVWIRGHELYHSSNPFDMKIEIKEPSRAPKVSPSTESTAPAAPGTAAPGTASTPPAAGGAASGTPAPAASGTTPPSAPPSSN